MVGGAGLSDCSCSVVLPRWFDSGDLLSSQPRSYQCETQVIIQCETQVIIQCETPGIGVKHKLCQCETPVILVSNISYQCKTQVITSVRNTSYQCECKTPVIISMWNSSCYISAKHQLSYQCETQVIISVQNTSYQYETQVIISARNTNYHGTGGSLIHSIYVMTLPVYGILDTQRFSDHRTPPDEVCGVFLFQGGIEHSTLRAT